MEQPYVNLILLSGSLRWYDIAPRRFPAVSVRQVGCDSTSGSMTIEFPGKASDFLKIGVLAAERGDIELVREILKARPKWLHRIGSHGRTMLWGACHRGKLPMVKYHFRRKADINACGTHYTPYFVEISCYCIARHKKHHEVADYLLEKGAVMNIHTAAFLGDCQQVAKFLKRSKRRLNLGHPQYVMCEKKADGLDFELAEADWATPLCYALRGGDVETVEYLIQQGATINGFEKNLFIAADDDYDMIRLLLENGADPAMAPEVHSDEGRLFDLIRSFGGKAADRQHANEELVYLCRGDRGGNPDEVKRWLSIGADVNFQDHKGKTALHRAAKAGFIETIEILLDSGASVELADAKGETALFDAVRSTIKDREKRTLAIRTLLKAGADVRAENRRGQTPLSVAEASAGAEGTAIAAMLRRSRRQK